MSALFRAEIVSLMRLVDQHAVEMAMDHNQRERARTNREGRLEIDRQAVLDVLTRADRHMTSTEISHRAGVNRQRVDRILGELHDQKLVRRHRRATRRADGEGFRNPYKYRINA